MRASIIKIGNSRGIRIPKKLLEEARLSDAVEIKLWRGKLIVSAPIKRLADSGMLLSRSALAKEWDSPEEEKAWASLQ